MILFVAQSLHAGFLVFGLLPIHGLARGLVHQSKPCKIETITIYGNAVWCVSLALQRGSEQHSTVVFVERLTCSQSLVELQNALFALCSASYHCFNSPLLRLLFDVNFQLIHATCDFPCL